MSELTRQQVLDGMVRDAERDFWATLQQLRDKAEWLARDMKGLVASCDRWKAGGQAAINSLGEAQSARDVNRLCALLEERRAKWNEAVWLRAAIMKAGE